MAKIQTKHFRALIVKNSIINFEKRPTKETMKDYLKNGIDSEFAKELIYIIEELKKHQKVESVKLRSFLLNDERSNTIINICESFGGKCKCKISNPFTDIFPFFATSLVVLNFKNIKRIGLIINECRINL